MVSTLAFIATFVHVLTLQPGVPSSPAVSDDGTIEVTVLAPGSIAEVRQALEDPLTRARLFPSVHDARVIARNGACVDLRMTTDGVSEPFVYDMRSCRTAQGWKDSLLSSTDLDSLDATWQLHSTDAGVEVKYRLKVALDLPVPRFLLTGRQGRDMVGALERLIRRLKP